MNRILVLYAHPAQHHSRVNAAMASRIATLENISLVDLYAEYPRFKIDVDREQQRLLQHDIVVMQFPLMWYSTPSLLKEWQDLVLEYGFGYGHGGDKLKDKTLVLAVSAGSSRESYQSDGLQNYELQHLLRPLEQMARLCQMQSLPPYVLFSSLDAAESPRLEIHLNTYCRYLCALRDGHLS
ncbi:MAG: NAD(P)H-dependent oxidoreductase, partial [Granulosicoccaceae bacterium]